MKISESVYSRMPENLRRLFVKLPNPGSEEVLAGFPETSNGDLTGQPRVENKLYGKAGSTIGTPRYYNGDSGSAARFFYCSKASKEDRDEGCEGLAQVDVYSEALPCPVRDDRKQTQRGNHHPTVKPTALMRYLCRLITPPGGIVLDPFMGSGSTGKACVKENFCFIGIENDTEHGYFPIAVARISGELNRFPLLEPPQPQQASLLEDA